MWTLRKAPFTSGATGLPRVPCLQEPIKDHLCQHDNQSPPLSTLHLSPMFSSKLTALLALTLAAIAIASPVTRTPPVGQVVGDFNKDLNEAAATVDGVYDPAPPEQYWYTSHTNEARAADAVGDFNKDVNEAAAGNTVDSFDGSHIWIRAPAEIQTVGKSDFNKDLNEAAAANTVDGLSSF
ncbi:hypothetical protein FB451DRAFT_1230583 [Mycena latifolia]|nr:hypothetical protein FB451DRAFT_1230583 [Mycena latifolia]